MQVVHRMMTDAPGREGGRRSGPCPAKAVPSLICTWIIESLARSRLNQDTTASSEAILWRFAGSSSGNHFQLRRYSHGSCRALLCIRTLNRGLVSAVVRQDHRFLNRALLPPSALPTWEPHNLGSEAFTNQAGCTRPPSHPQQHRLR
jgi:hypothetical protein